MASQARISIVVRPVDHALRVLRLALVPSVVAAITLPELQQLHAAYTFGQPYWLVGVVLLATAAVYLLLLQTDAVGKRIDHMIASIRRRIALASNAHDEARSFVYRVAYWLTPAALRAPPFEYTEQLQIVDRLVIACRQDPDGQYWFVEGPSGSGKTRTALLLVRALLRANDLFDLASRCYLYDFAASGAVQAELLRRLGTSRHKHALILVDNFHLVQASALRKLTNRLVDEVDTLPERLVIFFSQRGDAWSLSSGSNVRLVSKAKDQGRHLQLIGPPVEPVSRAVEKFDSRAAQLLQDLHEGPTASAVQLHLAEVIARNRLVPPEVYATLHLLGGAAAAPPSPEFIRLLATVSALSVHRGSFSRHEYRQAVWRLVRQLSLASRRKEAACMRGAFRRLRRVGIVPRPLSGKRYVFHEAVAELCVARLMSMPAFCLPFTTVARVRIGNLCAERDWSRAWLIAAEIGDDAVLEATFDEALWTGKYSRMETCLRRIAERRTPTLVVRGQRAVLMDRMGDFAGLRAEFADDLSAAFEAGDLGVVLASSRVETAHEDQSRAALNALFRHPDRLVNLVGRYWELHVAAHRGRFEPREMLQVAMGTLDLIPSQGRHWCTTALARMHFDSLRHLYLTGSATSVELMSSERRAIDAYLRPRVPTYEALHILYCKAHFVAHVLVPQLAIFNRSVSSDQAALAGLEQETARSVDGLVSAAQRLYRRASDEFRQYGDREAPFLEADLLNANMMEDGADLDELGPSLEKYQRFIDDAGFPGLASYPHFYFLRLHALRLLERGAEASEAAIHLNNALRHAGLVRHLDSVVRNEYGLLRCDVLEVLLRGRSAPFVGDELRALRRRAHASGYRFEEALIARLEERPTLTSAELRRILQFFPFVHQ